MWQNSPGTIERFVTLLCKHTDLVTLPFRIVRTLQENEAGNLYDQPPTEEEYEKLFALFRRLREPVITSWLKIIRSDTRDLLSAAAVDRQDGSINVNGCHSHNPDEHTTVTDEQNSLLPPQATDEKSNGPNTSQQLLPVSNAVDDEVDFGDDEDEDAEDANDRQTSSGPAPPLIFTNEILSLVHTPQTMSTGQELSAEVCTSVVECLTPFVERRTPLSHLTQCIFDEYYDKYPNRTTQLCQALRSILEKMDLGTTISERERAVVKQCIKELEAVYFANRAARDRPKEALPSRRVSWTHLQKRVKANVKEVVASLPDVPDDRLREAARVSLYVLEGPAPRGYDDYRQLTYEDRGGGGKPRNLYANGEIVLANYRTVASYGEFRFTVGEDTRALLDELVRRSRNNCDKEGHYILSGSVEPLAVDVWHNICASDFRRVYGRNKITIPVLRFSFVYHWTQAGKLKTTPYEKAVLGSHMGMTLPDVFAFIKHDIPDVTASSHGKRPRDNRSNSNEGEEERGWKRRASSEEVSLNDKESLSEVSMESGEIADGTAVDAS